MKSLPNAPKRTLAIPAAAVCSAMLALTVPAFAQTADSQTGDKMAVHHHHHHHMMHGKRGSMKEKSNGGDAETAKLNEQSLHNAQSNMAAPGASNAMTAPGTGTAPPSSGNMGKMMPSNAPPPPAAPTTPPSDGSGNK